MAYDAFFPNLAFPDFCQTIYEGEEHVIISHESNRPVRLDISAAVDCLDASQAFREFCHDALELRLYSHRSLIIDKAPEAFLVLDGCQMLGKDWCGLFIRERNDRCIFLIDETPEIFLILDGQKAAAKGWAGILIRRLDDNGAGLIDDTPFSVHLYRRKTLSKPARFLIERRDFLSVIEKVAVLAIQLDNGRAVLEIRDLVIHMIGNDSAVFPVEAYLAVGKLDRKRIVLPDRTAFIGNRDDDFAFPIVEAAELAL